MDCYNAVDRERTLSGRVIYAGHTVDIAQLKTLIHVAELGSLSKTADRLNIAQPALSRQIRLLEEELGVALCERHGRGMVITGAGRDVLDHAVRVMAELDAIRGSTTRGASSYRGLIAIGTTPTVASIVTVPLLKRIREHHPRLAVRFTSGFSGHLLDWVQRGDLDVAVSYDPQPLKSLRVVPVMMEDLLLVSAGPRVELNQPVPFARLASEPLILPSPRHGLRMIMDECARRAGITFEATVEADSFETMISLVRNGFGSTVLPLAPIYSLVEGSALSVVPLTDPAPTRTLVLAFAADRAVNPAASFIATSFVEIATDLVSRKIWAGRMLDSEAPDAVDAGRASSLR
ncbi:MAG: LysR substrate-binding domain-containing protein [Microvirga sp.]